MSEAVVRQDDAGTVAPARWGLRFAAIVLCAWVLVPIYLLAVDAFNAPKAVTGWPKQFWPAFDLTSLAFFWNYAGVTRALVNSLLVAGLTMVLSILIGAPAGYALARFRFRGKGAFRILVLMTRAFPLPLLALPLAVFYLRTGLDDTLLGLALIHTVLALPFAILITSSLFISIPVELEEAAWVFGCSRAQAFVRIVVPLALPGIAASGVFAFVTSWNEVFAASVLTVQNQTLTAFLLTSLDVSPLPLKFAGAFVLIIPALIFLFLVRKYLFSLWGIANR
ncbi:carbohydrate ABC transporter permease [Labrys neptuniae]|uniref:Carbohydrate ABC transporter permease n=1 Tax=Labrys neptuniae TaxID=376174 RepID=A0ABV3PS09_9HYPH|nr:carbohydrate ABC transporter permease [Labrys neptuniae]MDT3379208.1 carbohydrate ABC transporter permease [Labrys neptuniae]